MGYGGAGSNYPDPVTRRQLAAYLALAVIWGSSFVLIIRVAAAFGWAGAVSFRALIAGGALYLLARFTARPLAYGAWPPLAAVGASTVGAQLAGISYATPLIGTATAAMIVATIPLFSLLIGHLWGVEEITTNGRVGLFVGFLGMVLLVGFPEARLSATFVIGCGVMAFSSFAAALGSNCARAWLRDVGSWEQTIGVFLSGGLLTLPLLAFAPVPRAPSAADIGFLVLLALTCSSLTYVLYFRLVAEVGATTAISVEFLVTLVAVAIGALLLRERLSAVQLLGGGIIALGCALVLGLVKLPRGSKGASADAA